MKPWNFLAHLLRYTEIHLRWILHFLLWNGNGISEFPFVQYSLILETHAGPVCGFVFIRSFYLFFLSLLHSLLSLPLSSGCWEIPRPVDFGIILVFSNIHFCFSSFPSQLRQLREGLSAHLTRDWAEFDSHSNLNSFVRKTKKMSKQEPDGRFGQPIGFLCKDFNKTDNELILNNC